MNLRAAARVAALALIMGALACSDDGYETTDISSEMQVTPLFRGARQGDAPIQYNATVGGDAVAVTWESSDPAIATVSPTGLVNLVGEGFVAITATQTANSAAQKSGSLTIRPLFQPLESGVSVSNIDGDVGDTLYYRINVPAGATNLVVTMSGGTGDFDLYVRHATPPTYDDWDCRPYNSGNNESCPFPTPAAGLWYIWLDVYVDGDDATLVATVTAP